MASFDILSRAAENQPRLIHNGRASCSANLFFIWKLEYLPRWINRICGSHYVQLLIASVIHQLEHHLACEL